jgi:hypothetical protein
MPNWEAGQAEERGEVVLGGCCVTDDDPKWFCRECGRAWNENRGEQWENRKAAGWVHPEPTAFGATFTNVRGEKEIHHG